MKDNNHCKDCGTHTSALKEIPWGQADGTIQCKPCRIIEVNTKIENYDWDEDETSYGSDIICPHCGTKHDYNFEQNAFYDEGSHDFECEYCQTSFKVETSITTYYTTTKTD